MIDKLRLSYVRAMPSSAAVIAMSTPGLPILETRSADMPPSSPSSASHMPAHCAQRYDVDTFAPRAKAEGYHPGAPPWKKLWGAASDA